MPYAGGREEIVYTSDLLYILCNFIIKKCVIQFNVIVDFDCLSVSVRWYFLLI